MCPGTAIAPAPCIQRGILGNAKHLCGLVQTLLVLVGRSRHHDQALRKFPMSGKTVTHRVSDVQGTQTSVPATNTFPVLQGCWRTLLPERQTTWAKEAPQHRKAKEGWNMPHTVISAENRIRVRPFSVSMTGSWAGELCQSCAVVSASKMNIRMVPCSGVQEEGAPILVLCVQVTEACKEVTAVPQN